MKNKLQAIWNILLSKHYFAITISKYNKDDEGFIDMVTSQNGYLPEANDAIVILNREMDDAIRTIMEQEDIKAFENELEKLLKQ